MSASRPNAQSSGAVDRAALAYGEVDVSWQTVAFKKIKFATRENIGLGPVDIPAQQLPTTALWLTPDDACARRVEGGRLAGERRAWSDCATSRLWRFHSSRCATAAIWAAWSTVRISVDRR